MILGFEIYREGITAPKLMSNREIESRGKNSQWMVIKEKFDCICVTKKLCY